MWEKFDSLSLKFSPSSSDSWGEGFIDDFPHGKQYWRRGFQLWSHHLSMSKEESSFTRVSNSTTEKEKFLLNSYNNIDFPAVNHFILIHERYNHQAIV